MRGNEKMRVSYYKIAVGGAIGAMVYSAASLMLRHIGSELILFLLLSPCLWILWLFIAYAERKWSLWRVVGLWALIDIAALCLLGVSLSNARARSGPAGDDLALVIIYTPLIWPMIFASHLVPVSTLLAKLSPSLDAHTATSWVVLSVWIRTSLTVMIPSALWLCAVRVLEKVRRKP